MGKGSKVMAWCFRTSSAPTTSAANPNGVILGSLVTCIGKGMPQSIDLRVLMLVSDNNSLQGV